MRNEQKARDKVFRRYLAKALVSQESWSGLASGALLYNMNRLCRDDQCGDCDKGDRGYNEHCISFFLQCLSQRIRTRHRYNTLNGYTRYPEWPQSLSERMVRYYTEPDLYFRDHKEDLFGLGDDILDTAAVVSAIAQGARTHYEKLRQHIRNARTIMELLRASVRRGTISQNLVSALVDAAKSLKQSCEFSGLISERTDWEPRLQNMRPEAWGESIRVSLRQSGATREVLMREFENNVAQFEFTLGELLTNAKEELIDKMSDTEIQHYESHAIAIKKVIAKIRSCDAALLA